MIQDTHGDIGEWILDEPEVAQDDPIMLLINDLCVAVQYDHVLEYSRHGSVVKGIFIHGKHERAFRMSIPLLIAEVEYGIVVRTYAQIHSDQGWVAL